jgi:hypothetical protein
MGAFSGLRKARPTQGGQYLEPGTYTLQIKRVKLQESAAKSRTEWFIVEFKVIDTDHEKIKPGDERSWLVELPGEWPELSLGNIKAFLMTAYGSMAVAEGDEPPTEEEIGDEEGEAACEEDGPLVGVFVNAFAYNKKTKQDRDFTRVKWSIPDNLDELLEAAA